MPKRYGVSIMICLVVSIVCTIMTYISSRMEIAEYRSAILIQREAHLQEVRDIQQLLTIQQNAKQLMFEAELNKQQLSFSRQLKVQKEQFDATLRKERVERFYYGAYLLCHKIFTFNGIEKAQAEFQCRKGIDKAFKNEWHLDDELPEWKRNWRNIQYNNLKGVS